ncbi:hypothetical protein [Fimbriiglobus ruber]|uniref:Uncharacterized protein n=1 Tax=Fimbriiglobus ruber TaxID=1908690 RepID=A0A225DL50_9BACT|nr:hypothetical protein [Fimbriiglobus ruber]OWK37899.1 hypothetical protein FRUB_07019 [Fimbriiglobus ruber]
MKKLDITFTRVNARESLISGLGVGYFHTQMDDIKEISKFSADGKAWPYKFLFRGPCPDNPEHALFFCVRSQYSVKGKDWR